MSAGIYIHIPFCRAKCDYCSFYSVPAAMFGRTDEIPSAFIACLLAEAEERLPDGLPVDTVYFGGGTPSLLSIDQLETILRFLRERADIERRAEITVETNPGDASAEKLSGFRDAGVTRAVLGVQTLSPRLHRLIGRSAAPCSESDLDIFFGVAGLAQCVDIITGIPTQRDDELFHDIDTVAGYRPKHVSAYSLSVEEKTPLGRRLGQGRDEEPEQARLFELTMERLAGHGYAQYEISNYSLPGCESRHNMKYWRFLPYIGLGPGAHSFLNGGRCHNAMTVEEYLRPGRVMLRQDRRTDRSAAVEYILTGLRLLAGISLRDMEDRLAFHLPVTVMERIAAAEAEGLAVLAGDPGMTLRLTRRGVMLADSVIYRITEPLID
ncbi:MAG: radical SAM family heme chaperone HemW [Spirochaetes bacterium]|nr:radical SAM family heme chaperone HemW [Spirochaetota bacterium]